MVSAAVPVLTEKCAAICGCAGTNRKLPIEPMALQAASSGMSRRPDTLMAGARSDAADADVLELGELEDAVLRAFAARAALLHAAEGRDLGGDQPGVQADDAVFQRLGDSPGTRQVTRVDVGRQPELGVVGEADGLRIVFDLEQRRHRAEGFFAC